MLHIFKTCEVLNLYALSPEAKDLIPCTQAFEVLQLSFTATARHFTAGVAGRKERWQTTANNITESTAGAEVSM